MPLDQTATAFTKTKRMSFDSTPSPVEKRSFGDPNERARVMGLGHAPALPRDPSIRSIDN